MGEFVDETVADWVSSISNDPATQSMLEKVSTEIKAENQQFDDTLDKRLTSSLAAERNQYEQQVSDLRTLLASVTAERDTARERADKAEELFRRVQEYQEGIPNAFEAYLYRIAPNLRFHLPGGFFWCEVWREMITAALSESQKGEDEDA